MEKEPLILVNEHDNGVYKLTLNRPEVYNALCDDMMRELSQQILLLEDKNARAFVLTGNQKAFAAGGDIAEMQGLSYAEVESEQYVHAAWAGLENRRCPIIAAVNGFAFGGGCELVLLCDIVVAGRSAVFAQPETSIGIIPGAGGTQRLVRSVGKAKAMNMILAGYQMGAIEAERSGLVSELVDDSEVLEEALRIADIVATRSKPVIQAAKQTVDYAFNSSLDEGLTYEKARFYGMFALADQSEGMQAFIDKRKPNWQDS